MKLVYIWRKITLQYYDAYC